MNDGEVKRFIGDVDDYRDWLLQQEVKIVQAKKTSDTKLTPRQIQKEKQTLQNKIAKQEAKLDELHSRLKVQDHQLSDSQLYQDENKTQLDELLIQRQKMKIMLNEVKENILQMMQQLESK